MRGNLSIAHSQCQRIPSAIGQSGRAVPGSPAAAECNHREDLAH
jgi:hypothetical protein